MKFEWTQNISVNDEIIDNQHKKLLNQINLLLEAIIEEKSISIVKETISFLDSYISDHLKYEEEYMQKNFYPDTQKHAEIHGNFIKKYKEFKTNLDAAGPSKELLLEIQSFLGSWWIEHIGTEDKKYADFIKQNK